MVKEKAIKVDGDSYKIGGKTAAKFDNGKPRLDLMPWDALIGTAMVFTYGAVKYSARNWEKGMRWTRPFAAMLRHMLYWFMGEDFDSESGLHHLDHADCNLKMLQAYAKRGVGDDDRPDFGKALETIKKEYEVLIESMEKLSQETASAEESK